MKHKYFIVYIIILTTNSLIMTISILLLIVLILGLYLSYLGFIFNQKQSQIDNSTCTAELTSGQKQFNVSDIFAPLFTSNNLIY